MMITSTQCICLTGSFMVKSLNDSSGIIGLIILTKERECLYDTAINMIQRDEVWKGACDILHKCRH